MKTQPKFAKSTLMANGVLSCAWLLFLSALLYAWVQSHLHEPSWANMYYGISLTGLLIYGFALRLGKEHKINFALLTVSFGITLYLAEIALAFMPSPRILAAQKAGEVFDTRSKYEVLMDLRKEGIAAYPPFITELFIKSNGLISEGKSIYPLSGISRTVTVHCNESGQWHIYESDEHGFNNIPGLYKKGEIDLTLIGDSYVQGSCIQPGEDISQQLRETGFRTIGLGVGGNGPLSELGTLTEYGPKIQPKVVLWMYFEWNDINELFKEKESSLLLKYLERNFTQNLFDRQEEIDKSLLQYLTKKLQEEGTQRSYGKMMEILKLWNLRLRTGLVNPLPLPYFPGELMEKILIEARDRVATWDGQFYFVYLPEWGRYSGRYTLDSGGPYRDQILALVHKLSIPVIDFHEILGNHHDPLSLFPYRLPGHYTAEGYHLLAQTIKNSLEEKSLSAHLDDDKVNLKIN